MPPILLVAVNARYSHASLGVRSLLANMGSPWRDQAALLEFSINDPPERMATEILAARPSLAGIGVYIWNRDRIEHLLPLLKAGDPGMRIVLGGPEITHDADSALARAADCVVRGEGERLWPGICRLALQGRPLPRRPAPAPCDPAMLVLPDREYRDEDLHQRHLYIETSRGCPMHCAFCLSSLAPGIRYFDEPAVHDALKRLLDRGARQFRLVDRSFNLQGRRAWRLLDFFLERSDPGLRLHLELTPDGLRAAGLRERLARFPPGVLHLEAGIQSFDPPALAAVNRRSNVEAAADGIAWLTRETGATVHADLIAGLPGETLAGFAAGFDRLYRLGPAEIQIGLLKHLPGTVLDRDPDARFRSEPPYTVERTGAMSTADLADVRRMAAHWERVVHRGHFPRSVTRWLRDAPSPWSRFNGLSRRLHDRYGLYGIHIEPMAQALKDALCADAGLAPDAALALLREDWLAGGRRSRLPPVLTAPERP